jgi:outer membrane protein assembly factor BamE (lipoprotein component of BamABCDE complex)
LKSNTGVAGLVHHPGAFESGKVDRIANYGMKDRKVFDFISRTTPTGGSGPDFLKNIMGALFKFS